MKKLSLLLCFLVLSACNSNGNNVPVAAVENSQVIPAVPVDETPEIIEEEKEIEKPKFDLSLIMANDILPIESEKCTLSKHPFISFRRSYERATLKYLGDNTFDFNLQDYMDPLSGEGYNTNFTIGMELTSEVKDQAYFNLINKEEYVTQDIYFDLLIVGSWKMKEVTNNKMVLTANVFGDQCDYTFTIPSVHDTDNDGINDSLDCAPQDNTGTYWREYYVDSDNDGVGSEESNSICVGQSTSIPDGYAEESGDCDDTNPDKMWQVTLFLDQDQDGAPSNNNQAIVNVCYDSSIEYPNYMTDYDELDCDDSNQNINPWSEEIPGDGIDNNCDGVDEQVEQEEQIENPLEEIFQDTDQDGTNNLLDCAPDDSSRFQFVNLYLDQDLDGFGAKQIRSMCVGSNLGLPGYSELSTDCNDQNRRIYSGAPEILGDTIDNNCDGNAD